jgi:hypothetical protein
MALVREPEELEPYGVVPECAESGPAASRWRERAQELGIADLPLRVGRSSSADEVVAGAREA